MTPEQTAELAQIEATLRTARDEMRTLAKELTGNEKGNGMVVADDITVCIDDIIILREQGA